MNRRHPVTLSLSLASVAGVILLLSGCGGGGTAGPQEPLQFPVPLHFLSANVESDYPTTKAIPNAAALEQIEGASVSIQSDPDFPAAQLRIIQLPPAMHAKQAASHVLAESGAIQTGDVITVFRPEWSRVNGYGNVQLGQGHAALTFIQEDEEGKKFVHTLENPLPYSSRLNHEEHYGGHDLFHIMRPSLSDKERSHIKAWSELILARPDAVGFHKNYGAPYPTRPKEELDPQATGDLPVDLAAALLKPEAEARAAAYCSELVWAILALRKVDPAGAMTKFGPQGENAPLTEIQDWLAGKVSPLFDPLPGATPKILSSPGLVQGPDLQLRRVLAGDHDRRREHLLSEVFLEEEASPAQSLGIMSGGHLAAARAYQQKILQLRQFYANETKDETAIQALNLGVNPNYSPAAFFILANRPSSAFGGKLIRYVGTVSFRRPATVARVITE